MAVLKKLYLNGTAYDVMDLNVSNLANYYTKTEVDTKMSGVYKFKGTKATYEDLPSSGNVLGDVWNVTTEHKTNPKFPAGSNLAWDGSAWDVLGGIFELPTSATAAVAGLVKLGSDTEQTVAANAVSSTTNRTYAVQANASGQLVVNVPWTDTTYESKVASEGGTDVSLVTTGEKYNWNGKQDAMTLPNSVTSGNAVTFGSDNKTLVDAGGAPVLVSGNQTIAGTKTFTTSPVVPSKTTAASNTGTAIATEAQVYLKANDADVVKLTGDQSIAGTKTFTTSPVVPSKTTDAANAGTAVATEAQVYKKSTVRVVTQDDYEDITGASTDGIFYFIYEDDAS